MARKPLSDLDAPSHGFFGKVRRAKDKNSVWFARLGDSHWTQIPRSQVEDMIPVAKVRRGKQVEHLVHMVMKPPASAEGKTFAALAHLHSVPMAAATTGGGGMCYDGATHTWFPCPKVG